MKKMFVCGNWKMNTDLASALSLARALVDSAKDLQKVEVGCAPPFVYLKSVADVVKGANVSLASQNMYFAPSGAFTGETSAAMMLDVGCDYAILGHSERRHVFGESDTVINKKVLAALAAGLKVILCAGELLEEREAGDTENVVRRHVTEGLSGVSTEDMARIVIAYEPVWAIGTGKTATPAQANEVHIFIRGLLSGLYDADVAAATRIQYGGSVKPDNTFELMSQSEVDGALVGGASLKADSFASIISEALKACS